VGCNIDAEKERKSLVWIESIKLTSSLSRNAKWSARDFWERRNIHVHCINVCSN
jgi:hypothetical protein